MQQPKEKKMRTSFRPTDVEPPEEQRAVELVNRRGQYHFQLLPLHSHSCRRQARTNHNQHWIEDQYRDQDQFLPPIFNPFHKNNITSKNKVPWK